MFSRIVSLLILFSLSVPLAGCGSGASGGADRPDRVPVSGTITYKQQPVEGATVVFVPVGETPSAAARTDAKGHYELRTFDPEDGAVPGEYWVTVSKTEMVGGPAAGSDDDAESESEAEERLLLPGKYDNAQTSGLTASVTEGDDNKFDFDLEGKITGKRSKQPATQTRGGE